MSRHRLVLLAATIASVQLAAPARAQQAPPAMTLESALSYAHEHQPSLLAARARIQASRAAAFIPRAAWYPRAAASAQFLEGTTNNTTTSYVGTAGIDLPRIGGTRTAATGSWNPSPSALGAVGVRQEVFDFGRIAALSAASDALTQVEQARGDRAAVNLDFAIEESFLAVKAAKAVLSASEAAVKRAEAHRDEARAGVQSGLRRPIDFTRAEADVARFEVGRVRALGGVTTAQSLFAAAVGVPSALLDTAGEAKSPAPAPPPERALQLALASDPSLRAANALVQFQQAQTTAIGAELRPDLQLTGSLSARAGGGQPTAGAVPNGSGYLPDVQNWDVGLVFSWPLFDQTVRARRETSSAQELVRRSEVDETRATVVAAVQQSSVALNTAEQAVPALQRSVAAAQANFAQANARAHAGLSSQIELADADALLVDAEISLALGEFEAARERARLGRLISEAP
jgi:outer membrane protein